MQRPALIAAALVVACLGVYAQTASFDFIEFDDDRYVSNHAELLGPFDASAVAWAFEPVVRVANWQPITLLSYRFDSALHGIDAAGPYHVTNVVWHILATLLLFAAMRSLSGRDVESGIVAALFAVHPLHVESVAWVSSRKDVLVAAGWWAATWAYVAYVRADTSGRRWVAYAVSLVAFSFALLAKPLAVTLPFALLLFDAWPLARWNATARDSLRLAAEKLPFFAFSAVASIVTIAVQRQAGAMESGKALTLLERVGNAVVACATYVTTSVWPSGLAVFYPHPSGPSQVGLVPLEVAASAVLLVALSTLAAFAARRGYASVAVGWCFFLGTLVPMLGIIQVGFASHADRYTYVSQTGLAIALVFGSSEWLRRTRPQWLRASAVSALLACATLGVAAHAQASLWRDTPTLFEHSLAVTERNDLIEFNYGTWFKGQGDLASAKARFARALKWNPDKVDAAVNLGLILHTEGEREVALGLLRGALARAPLHATANLNLGIALGQAEQWDEARRYFEVVLAPEASAVPSERHQALISIGTLDQLQGNGESAAGYFERALAQQPDDPVVLAALVDLYTRSALLGAGEQAGRAVELARQLVRVSGDSAESLARLARANFAWGDRAAAEAAAERALERVRLDDPDRAAQLEALRDGLRAQPQF